MPRLRLLAAALATGLLVTLGLTAAPPAGAAAAGTLRVSIVDSFGVPQTGLIALVPAGSTYVSPRYQAEGVSTHDFTTVTPGRYAIYAVTYWGGMVCAGLTPCSAYGGQATAVPGVVDVVDGQVATYTMTMTEPAITLGGTPAVGSALSVDPSPSLASWLGSVYSTIYGGLQYQWLRDGVAVPTATSKTYPVTAADAGHQLSVQVGYAPNTEMAGYVGTEPTSRGLGPVSVPLQATQTFVGLGRSRITTKDRGRVRVDVTSGNAVVDGSVSITLGTKVWSAVLRNGTARLQLSRLKAGTYSVGAAYLPAAGYAASTATPAKLVVKQAKKPKKHKKHR